MKYSGGYQMIDLGGMEIKTTHTEITDPKIIGILKNVYYGVGGPKPLYLSNYVCHLVSAKCDQTILMDNITGIGSNIVHAFFDNNSTPICSIIINLDNEDHPVIWVKDFQ